MSVIRTTPWVTAPLLMAGLMAACGRSTTGTAKPAGVTYPATKEGLHQLIADIADAEAAGKADQSKTLSESLTPPDYKGWFNSTLGPEVGTRLIAEYEPHISEIPTLGKLLKQQRDRGRTEILVESFSKADDLEATGYQAAALREAKTPLTLYSVRLVEPGKKSGMHLNNFIHDGKNFRFVGQMKMIKGKPDDSAQLDALASIRLREAKEFFATGKLPE